MDTFEQSRWYALMEAVNVIAGECEKRGKSFDELRISPLDVEKYIEGTCDIFARKINEEHENLQRAISLNLADGIVMDLQEV